MQFDPAQRQRIERAAMFFVANRPDLTSLNLVYNGIGARSNAACQNSDLPFNFTIIIGLACCANLINSLMSVSFRHAHEFGRKLLTTDRRCTNERRQGCAMQANEAANELNADGYRVHV